MLINKMIVLFIVLIMVSCKNEPTTASHSKGNSYDDAVLALKTNPGKESLDNFFRETAKVLEESKSEMDTKAYLLRGLKVAEENKLPHYAIGYLVQLLRTFPDDQKREEYLAKLASAIKDVGKEEVGNILISAYIHDYPKGIYRKKLEEKNYTPIEDIHKIIEDHGKKVFDNPDKMGINRKNAQAYIDVCEAYVLGNPGAKDAPVYLYKASEIARTLKTYHKALSLYDWIMDKYPDFDKAATVLFLKGFMLENELKDKEKAKVIYRDFLQKYPDHGFADDVKFLLDNIDKSDEELRAIIEKNKDKK